MRLISSPVALLAWLGRHGAAGFAVAIFAGLALPGLANAFRPLLPVTIFLFVTLSFARADFGGLRKVAQSPLRLARGFAWATLCLPALIGVAVTLIGRDAIEPGLLLGIALMAAAPPLMGFPAYVALLGLDNSLGIALLVVSLAATPLIAPPLATFVAGAAVPLHTIELGIRLLTFLSGTVVAALVLRRVAGPARLAARRHELDGLNVVIYFVFAVAAMDGVIDTTLTRPGEVLLHLAVGVGVSVVSAAGTMLALRPFGREDAFVLALGTSMRNTGLLIVSLGAACPPSTYLFFSLLQVPIYCAPLALKPIADRVLARR